MFFLFNLFHYCAKSTIFALLKIAKKIFVAVFAVQQGDTHTNEEHAALHPKQDADYVGNEFGVDDIVERCVAVVFLGLKVVSRLAHIR